MSNSPEAETILIEHKHVSSRGLTERIRPLEGQYFRAGKSYLLGIRSNHDLDFILSRRPFGQGCALDIYL